MDPAAPGCGKGLRRPVKVKPNLPPSLREGDRKAVEGVCFDRKALPQSADADSPLLEGAKFSMTYIEETTIMNVYETKTMAQRLDGNTYPGRGIVLGVTADGKKAVAAYFIMGRSVNSRNRVFCVEPDGIRTEAHDPALMKDPHLIIYHPVRELGNGLIVTNGDQTDTIWEFAARGESWEAALRTRQFEDDGPNWTPRISGIQANDGSYKMSILKAADPEGKACSRFFWEYPATAGLGHFLHTYVCDGNPVIPTFQGEPERVTIPGDIDEFTKELWENLDENNKISLFVRYTDIATREVEQRIINKHK